MKQSSAFSLYIHIFKLYKINPSMLWLFKMARKFSCGNLTIIFFIKFQLIKNFNFSVKNRNKYNELEIKLIDNVLDLYFISCQFNF